MRLVERRWLGHLAEAMAAVSRSASDDSLIIRGSRDSVLRASMAEGGRCGGGGGGAQSTNPSPEK